MYLYARLAGRVKVEVVPGVSSLMACAIASRSPRREERRPHVIPAPLPEVESAGSPIVEAAAIIKPAGISKVRRVLRGRVSRRTRAMSSAPPTIRRS